MSESATNGKRLLRVTAGNIRNSHLSVRGHLDFFPADCLGPSRKPVNGNGHGIEVHLAGLNETVATDIAVDKAIFRDRRWVRRFFSYHTINPGDLLELERLNGRHYRLAPARRSSGNGKSFTAAEFFAGIGSVRLALEKHDWQVVFANDIDRAKAEMYRHNWPDDDHLVVEDIHRLNAADIPTCDLFTASFPCNDLSIAGRWEGIAA